MNILDVHVHYTGNEAEAERFVSLWKQNGVDKAVVFAITADDGSYAPLEKITALAERFSDFVIPFAYLNPGYHDALAEAKEAIARGFRGLKFIFSAKPYDVDEYFPIYELAAKAGMVCLFHTGIVASLGDRSRPDHYERRWRVSSNNMRPAHLDRIARSFPEMNIIGAHLGAGAWYEEATELMSWNHNLYFDLSIGQLHYQRKNVPEGQEGRAIRPRIQELYDTGQLDLNKVMFGSDGMMGTPQANPNWALRTLKFELDAIGATEEEKQAVRWKTAARLLGVK